MRLNRIAYRELTRRPDLPFEEFRQRVQTELLPQQQARAVDDLLFLQESFFEDVFAIEPLD